MVDIIVENMLEVLSAFLIAVIGIVSAYIGKKIGTKKELENIDKAKDEACSVMISAVGELKQKFSDGYKEANADGKLTDEEIKELNTKLADLALEYLSEPAKKILEGARIDVVKYILGIADAYINQNH